VKQAVRAKMNPISKEIDAKGVSEELFREFEKDGKSSIGTLHHPNRTWLFVDKAEFLSFEDWNRLRHLRDFSTVENYSFSTSANC
jgi:hypothetical protein